MRNRLLSLVALSLGFAACTASPPSSLSIRPDGVPLRTAGEAIRIEPAGTPQDRGLQTPSTSPSGGTVRLDQWSVEAFYMPFVAIDIDSDEDTPSATSADVDRGDGFGAGISIGDDDQGIGLLYMGSSHTELTTGTDLRADAIYADFHARGLFWQQGSTRAWARFNGGAGVAFVSFDGPFEDQTTGALDLRGVLQLEFSKRFSLDLGLGGFLWGVPGDTVAFGSFMTAGGSLRF